MQINANVEKKAIRQTCISAHQSFYEISNSWMLKYLLSPEEQVQTAIFLKLRNKYSKWTDHQRLADCHFEFT